MAMAPIQTAEFILNSIQSMGRHMASRNIQARWWIVMVKEEKMSNWARGLHLNCTVISLERSQALFIFILEIFYSETILGHINCHIKNYKIFEHFWPYCLPSYLVLVLSCGNEMRCLLAASEAMYDLYIISHYTILTGNLHVIILVNQVTPSLILWDILSQLAGFISAWHL